MCFQADSFRMYCNYCANQENAWKLFEELSQTNESFQEALKDIFSHPALTGRDIYTVITLPITRMCKYSLITRVGLIIELLNCN